MDALLELLRRSGYRITQPRRAVIEALSAGPSHITADTVLKLGRRCCPSLSKASVYRTLQLLESVGALRGIPSADGRQYVQVASGHHHLVCQSCGEVRDFPSCGMCENWLPAVKDRGFHVAGHLLEVFGWCEGCKERR